MLFITDHFEAPRVCDRGTSSSACSPLEQAIAQNPPQHPSADRFDILEHRRDLSHALPLLLTNENAIKHDWPFDHAIHFSTPVHYCRAIIVPCLHLPLECPSVPRLLLEAHTYSTYIGGLTLCKQHTLGLSLHPAWLISSRHCYHLPNCRSCYQPGPHTIPHHGCFNQVYPLQSRHHWPATIHLHRCATRCSTANTTGSKHIYLGHSPGTHGDSAQVALCSWSVPFAEQLLLGIGTKQLPMEIRETQI
jgi:hypothetical protein